MRFNIKIKKRSSHSAKMKSLALDPSLQLRPKSGLSEIQGKRDYMEDRSITIDNLKEEIPSELYIENTLYSFFAVYDGHAGYRAAEICKESFHKLLVTNRYFSEGDIPKAIQVCLKFFIFFIFFLFCLGMYFKIRYSNYW